MNAGTDSEGPQSQNSAQWEPTPLSATEKSSRNWSMLCHLSALIGLGINVVSFLYFIPLGIFGPLIVWLLKKNEYPSADEHGREATNFQLTCAGLQFVFCLLPIIGWFVLLPLLVLINVGLTILAAVKASNGERYRYPFSLRLFN